MLLVLPLVNEVVYAFSTQKKKKKKEKKKKIFMLHQYNTQKMCYVDIQKF